MDLGDTNQGSLPYLAANALVRLLSGNKTSKLFRVPGEQPV